MKYWIYRSKVKFEHYPDLHAEHFVEQNPDKAYVYTKLYFCYDQPLKWPCPDSSRYVELPNYWYPEIKPDQLIEFESKEI